MRVLVIGATGFIGSRIASALQAAGHELRLAGRSPARIAALFPGRPAIGIDLKNAGDPADWREALRGVEAVVNAAGGMGAQADVRQVQTAAPLALFAAARAAGIAHFVQISAIGAGAANEVLFLASKGRADADLARDKPPGWTVLRPSLVYGRGGGSAQLFAALAALPIQPGFASGPVRPIHVDDLARAAARLIESDAPLPAVIDAVGPEEGTVDDLVAAHRRWLGHTPAPRLPIPGWMLRLAGKVGDRKPGAAVNSERVTMLAAGATADPAPFRAIHAPAGLDAGLAREPATRGDRLAARLFFAPAVVRGLLAVVWIGTALVCLLDIDAGRALLVPLGITGALATSVVVAGALWDGLLGLALLARWRPRTILLLQLATMATYTLIATIGLPALWLDPLGALLKNFAVLGLTLTALALEE